MDDEASRIYQVRRTILQMMVDRGYIVQQTELSLDKESFIAKYTGNDSDIPKRGDLTLLLQKKDDPTDQIFVFWPDDIKVGVKDIKKYTSIMQDQSVYNAIMIVQKQLTSFAKAALNEMAPRYTIEHFMESELRVNITEHQLVPKHILLTELEKQTLLQRYKLNENQLPRIQVTDPVARYFGMKKGQVVKIIRHSETAGRYVTYRLVV